MSGFSAGIISVATLLVGAAIVTTLVKNSQGSTGIIDSIFAGFNKSLATAQGN